MAGLYSCAGDNGAFRSRKVVRKMEIIEAIKSAPEWGALIVALVWNYHLQKQVGHMQDRIERMSDRQETLREKLLAKLTKTDLGE